MLLGVLVIAILMAAALDKVREQGLATAALYDAGCVIIYADNADDNSPTTLEHLRTWFG